MSLAATERLSADVKESPEIMTWNAATGELETWSYPTQQGVQVPLSTLFVYLSRNSIPSPACWCSLDPNNPSRTRLIRWDKMGGEWCFACASKKTCGYFGMLGKRWDNGFLDTKDYEANNCVRRASIEASQHATVQSPSMIATRQLSTPSIAQHEHEECSPSPGSPSTSEKSASLYPPLHALRSRDEPTAHSILVELMEKLDEGTLSVDAFYYHFTVHPHTLTASFARIFFAYPTRLLLQEHYRQFISMARFSDAPAHVASRLLVAILGRSV
ncbi:hypothetical protein BOTBODRAFT_181733 [Botryobasidium botryosum FD-172 SS1]|uniref:Uncharacterized protein n=1 Tax=Botryobasidium botryosum (strain FD-172 SS1) TaxID=930990 RepID=A0A067M3Y0_BOTB1|nr:hypothetical protein BOTBODRAFT_181733 [Botryobasidium botryosum FD-172 SS1]